MKYEVVVTRQFRKDYKLAIKRGYAQEKLEHVIITQASESATFNQIGY